MRHDFGTLDAALAAAIGDDVGLMAELRTAFVEGATTHVDALDAAGDDGRWTAECWRLHGLAASFGAISLMSAAAAAAERGPGADALARLRTQLALVSG